MKLALRHAYDFGNLRELVGEELESPEAWDRLRLASADGFGLPSSREQLTADVRTSGLDARAGALERWLAERDVATLASYGVGAAHLECAFHALSRRKLLLTEYAPETAARLRQLMPELHVIDHDLRVDAPVAADLHLFHRIDTEFSDQEWRVILNRFGADRVLVVAAGVLDARRLVAELRARLRYGRTTRAGWLRTQAAYRSLWSGTHDVAPVAGLGLPSWFLTPRALERSG